MQCGHRNPHSELPQTQGRPGPTVRQYAGKLCKRALKSSKNLLKDFKSIAFTKWRSPVRVRSTTRFCSYCASRRRAYLGTECIKRAEGLSWSCVWAALLSSLATPHESPSTHRQYSRS